MAMLKARLYEIELKRREAAVEAMKSTKTDIGWGHQIRSYVLQPYQIVKDLRTGIETSQSDKVLDGDLDRFLEASLAQRIKGADATAAEGRGRPSGTVSRLGAEMSLRGPKARPHSRRKIVVHDDCNRPEASPISGLACSRSGRVGELVGSHFGANLGRAVQRFWYGWKM